MSDWDITLDSTNYMLVPGSYRAFHASAHDPALGRQNLTDFASGLNQVAGDSLLSGSRAWPAARPLSTGGIGPAPLGQSVNGTIASSTPKLTASDQDNCYIVAGTTIYRWDRQIANAPTNRKTLAASATCLTRLRGGLFIGHGGSADVAFYDDATNTLTASALGAGVKASLLGSFSRAIVLVTPNFPMTLHIFYGNSLSYVRSWSLDGNILRFVQLGNRMIVATDAGLHVLSGDWYQDTDPPAPPETLRLTSWGTLSGQLQDEDDFSWMTVYQGRLFAWLGKRVVQLDEGRETWQPAGLAGGATTGAAVVNGWLLVATSPSGAPATFQIWGYDGFGWWLLDATTTTNTLQSPAADGAGRLLAFTASSGVITAWDLDDHLTAANLASPFSITTALLDAKLPEQPKRWRQIGVEFRRTDAQPVGNWSAAIDYSTDAGTTWTSVGSPPAITDQLASLRLPLDVTANALLLRLTLTRTSGLPPFVTSIWADHVILPDIPPRRWQFRIQARPRGVNRAGSLDSRDGQQIRSTLWTHWQDATPVAFRDVDYATTTTERTVRIAAISEAWPKPADAAILGAFTVLDLTLEEV